MTDHHSSEKILSSSLNIIYQDEAFIAVNKPSGVMTHRSRIAEDDEPSAMERLRDQIGSWVYPVHRLDRATSGILLFGRSKESARSLHESFALGNIAKVYWAITRGHAPIAQEIDRALKEKRDRITDKYVHPDKPAQTAKTHIETLAHVTLPVPLGRYSSARFSLVQACPKTGRRHQLRRHLAGINYPIVGDTTHGRGEQNRFFREQFDCHRLLLAAVNMRLPHPQTGEEIELNAPLSEVMLDVCHQLFINNQQEDPSTPVESSMMATQPSINCSWLQSFVRHRHLLASPQA